MTPPVLALARGHLTSTHGDRKGHRYSCQTSRPLSCTAVFLRCRLRRFTGRHLRCTRLSSTCNLRLAHTRPNLIHGLAGSKRGNIVIATLCWRPDRLLAHMRVLHALPNGVPKTNALSLQSEKDRNGPRLCQDLRPKAGVQDAAVAQHPDHRQRCPRRCKEATERWEYICRTTIGATAMAKLCVSCAFEGARTPRR